MDHEELVKLAGELALLLKERCNLSAVFNRDKQTLLDEINSGHKTTWLVDGIALLQGLKKTQTEICNLNSRITELAKLTGL